MAKKNFHTEKRQARIKKILDFLRLGSATSAEISEALFMSRTSVVQYLEFMMKDQPRQMHRSAWITGEGPPKPVYSFGDGRHKIKPRRRTQKQRHADYFERLKADPEKHLQHLNKRKARRLQAAPKCDPAAAWIHDTRKLQAEAAKQQQ